MFCRVCGDTETIVIKIEPKFAILKIKSSCYRLLVLDEITFNILIKYFSVI